MDSVLFIVPHPDDVAYGMGGTALMLRNKFQLHIACASKGERGIPGEPDLAKVGAIREVEGAAEAAMLGAHLTFLGCIDREVLADQRTNEKVADLLMQIKPRAVFTIWPVDSHPDHSASYEITRKALFLTGLTPEVYFCEESMGDQTTSFTPRIYVDISSVFEEKKKLIRLHPSQNVKDCLVADATRQNSFRGLECGCQFAEGYQMAHPITNKFRSVLLEI